MNTRAQRLRHREHVLVRGRIVEERFVADWWVTPSNEMLAELPPGPPESSWSVHAVDGQGRVLARALAHLDVADICSTDEFVLHIGALLALPVGTKGVIILENDREVYRRSVPEPSRISLTAMPERLERGAIDVGLQIDSASLPEGAYVVFRWDAPNGESWPLAISPATGSTVTVNVDLTDVPGGEGGHLVATFYDGIRAATVESDVAYLEPRSSQPIVRLPYHGMQLDTDGFVPLEGELTGDGDMEALRWLVDGAVVAEGTTTVARGLQPGRHTITLRYVDLEDTVDVYIVEASTVDPTPIDPVPSWRVDPATWLGTNI